MADNGTGGSLQRYGGYAVLAVVVVAVVALVVWLFVSGGDEEAPPAAPDPTPAATPTPAESPPPTEAPDTASQPPVEPTPTPTPDNDAALGIGVIESHRPEIGQPAPDFALRDARNPDRIVRLSDFRGTPVVLNWYASWCGPCRREIPDFQKAYAALDGEVVFLGVNLQEDAERAVGLLDVFVAEYPALLDTRGEVAAHYRIPGMPTTFFIDAQGIVRALGAGLIVEEVLVEELAKIGVSYTPE